MVNASSDYHQDHVGGMADLRRATGAPVSAHPLEAPHLAGEPGWTIPNPVEPKWLCPLLSATALDDGDTPPLLGGATVIHTGGHTPGSISLHFPDVGALIVANALQRYGNRLTLPSR